MRKIDGRPALVQYGTYLFSMGNAVIIVIRNSSLLWVLLACAAIAYLFPNTIIAARFYVAMNGKEEGR